jgi:3-hydroxy-D-aspartate aldolase
MNEKTKGMSQTRQVFAELRTAIVGGRLLPGSKLNIAALAEELDVSAGAVREGLAMLEAEALVVSEPSRGYRVSPISPEDLDELIGARIEIEKLCLAEAIRHGDLAWEGSVVSAHHRLSRLAERDAAMPTVLSAEWTSSHADFHNALVSGCPNSWLLRMHQMLYQQSERYRQLSAPLGKAVARRGRRAPGAAGRGAQPRHPGRAGADRRAPADDRAAADGALKASPRRRKVSHVGEPKSSRRTRHRGQPLCAGITAIWRAPAARHVWETTNDRADISMRSFRARRIPAGPAPQALLPSPAQRLSSMFQDLQVNAPLIGVPGGRHLLDTPALLIDLPAMTRNIERMAAFAKARGVNLRPHVKTHKSVEIARRQVAAGAIGVSCVTLGEAEVMVAGGIPGVLITSPAVTPSKIARLVKLAQRARPGDVMVVVDNPRNLADLAQAASELTHPLDVLVDYGAGYNRTGCATQAKVLELAAAVAAEPRLRLRGLQSYAGNLQHIVARDQRSAAAAGLRETVAGIVAAAKRQGLHFEIVTGAGTGTHDLDAQDNAFTELQAGSYVFMDAEYTQVLASDGQPSPFEVSLFVQTAVVSTNAATG